MILTSSQVPINTPKVKPATPPYIQVGVETGQKNWQIHINSPEEGLFDEIPRRFQGPLNMIADEVHWTIHDIAKIGSKKGLSVRVVYEAGCFGQKFGQGLSKLKDVDIVPIQLVARNIEYVRFGRHSEPVPKTDSLDAKRQAYLPLEDPNLPYANVQAAHEENNRDLLREQNRLAKEIKRTNSQMCSILRRCQIHVRHQTIRSWERFLEKEESIDSTKRDILCNHLESLRIHVQQRDAIKRRHQKAILEQAATWQPPNPAAQPAEKGRHPLQALGENSPLRDKPFSKALLNIKGIGTQSMLMLVTLVGDPRNFKNKKAFRAYLGLAPVPHNSCTIRRSKGMKGGNPKLRKLMIQLAWRWCSLQPDTALAKKYSLKLNNSRRSKKIAICALAGELAELLFCHLVYGKEVPGLSLKTP